jgi:hypothetical protein
MVILFKYYSKSFLNAYLWREREGMIKWGLKSIQPDDALFNREWETFRCGFGN